MINHLDILDNFGVPDNLTDADAEYVRIKLARTQSSVEAEKYRNQLHIIEEKLKIDHRKLVNQINKKHKGV